MATNGKFGEGKPFKEMGFIEKLVFLVKVVIFLATAGFAFPRILAD